jgi:hypothetical protein
MKVSNLCFIGIGALSAQSTPDPHSTPQKGIRSLPFYHEIEEGYVGVKYWFSTRQPTLFYTGANFDGWNHEVRPVQISWQIDHVFDVICPTKHGERVKLDIRVENKLVNSSDCVFRTIRAHTENYDERIYKNYIQSEVAQFCKDYTFAEFVLREFDKVDEVLTEKLKANIHNYELSDCLIVNKVHIDPPKMSDEMQLKFTETALQQQEQELKKQTKETERIQQEIDLQNQTAEQDRQLMIATKTAEKQEIEDQMHQHTTQKTADADLYMQEKKAQAVKTLIEAHGSPQVYLTAKQIKAHRDSKNRELHFYGSSDNLPNTVYNIGSLSTS